MLLYSIYSRSPLHVLQGCSRPKKGETRAEAAERRDLAVSALQALAIDYDLGDHDILKGSILLEVNGHQHTVPTKLPLQQLSQASIVAASDM